MSNFTWFLHCRQFQGFLLCSAFVLMLFSLVGCTCTDSSTYEDSSGSVLPKAGHGSHTDFYRAFLILYCIILAIELWHLHGLSGTLWNPTTIDSRKHEGDPSNFLADIILQHILGMSGIDRLHISLVYATVNLWFQYAHSAPEVSFWLTFVLGVIMPHFFLGLQNRMIEDGIVFRGMRVSDMKKKGFRILKEQIELIQNLSSLWLDVYRQHLRALQYLLNKIPHYSILDASQVNFFCETYAGITSKLKTLLVSLLFKILRRFGFNPKSYKGPLYNPKKCDESPETQKRSFQRAAFASLVLLLASIALGSAYFWTMVWPRYAVNGDHCSNEIRLIFIFVSVVSPSCYYCCFLVARLTAFPLVVIKDGKARFYSTWGSFIDYLVLVIEIIVKPILDFLTLRSLLIAKVAQSTFWVAYGASNIDNILLGSKLIDCLFAYAPCYMTFVSVENRIVTFPAWMLMNGMVWLCTSCEDDERYDRWLARINSAQGELYLLKRCMRIVTYWKHYLH